MFRKTVPLSEAYQKLGMDTKVSLTPRGKTLSGLTQAIMVSAYGENWTPEVIDLKDPLTETHVYFRLNPDTDFDFVNFGLPEYITSRRNKNKPEKHLVYPPEFLNL